VLAKYHANGQMDDELVLYEMDEINTALAIESKYAKVGWSVLWNTPANMKMALTISVFIMCLWYVLSLFPNLKFPMLISRRCGQGVISYYFSPLLTSLHITGTNQQTGINGGMQICNFLISILGACLADRIGRRSLWLVSLIAMICSNIGITITSAVFAHNDTNNAAAYVAILFLFFYNAGFNIAMNPSHTRIRRRFSRTQ
jgi:MFS family permease